MKKILSLILAINIFLTMLVGITVNAKSFNDVPITHKYYDAINKLSDLQLINGYADGYFGVENVITRCEGAVLVYRSLGISGFSSSSTSPYTDIDTTHWAYVSINTLVEMGVFDVDTTKLFRPNDAITYIEAIQAIVNAMGYKQDATNAGGYPNGYKAVAVNIGLTKNIDIINNNQSLTRGDFCQLLYNYYLFEDTTGTEISGIIETDTTWTKANSPYIVKGNILVDVGAILTIEPGVEIHFAGNYYIQVRGNLQAIGTEDKLIKFKGVFGTAWAGIDIKTDNNTLRYGSINQKIGLGGTYSTHITNNEISCSNTNGFNLSYCNNSTIKNNIITGGGVWLDGSNNNQIIDNSIAYYDVGINVRNGDNNNIIKNNLVSNCAYGLFIQDGDSNSVANNTIQNNQIGIYIDSYLGNQKNSIKYNNIRENNLNAKNFYNKPWDLSQNYWGTTDKAIISDKIFDFYDDFNYGKITYEPFLTLPFNDGYIVSSKNSGTFTKPIEISLSAIGENYSIYYTLDGTDPATNGILYTTPFTLSANTTLKAATKKNDVYGEVQEYVYIFNILPANLDYIINSVKLYSINENLLSEIPELENFYVQIEVKKNVINNGEKLIVALYDKDNKLIKMHTTDEFLKTGLFKGETAKFAQYISQTQGKKNDKIKVFIWKSFGQIMPSANTGLR